MPDELLGQPARDSQVDFYAKKLKGKIIFKLLLFSVLTYKDNSLRRMESHYISLIDPEKESSGISISSLSERLSHIQVDFFKRIYEKCVELYGPLIAACPKDVIYYDSTIPLVADLYTDSKYTGEKEAL